VGDNCHCAFRFKVVDGSGNEIAVKGFFFRHIHKGRFKDAFSERDIADDMIKAVGCFARKIECFITFLMDCDVGVKDGSDSGGTFIKLYSCKGNGF